MDSQSVCRAEFNYAEVSLLLQVSLLLLSIYPVELGDRAGSPGGEKVLRT